MGKVGWQVALWETWCARRKITRSSLVCCRQRTIIWPAQYLLCSLKLSPNTKSLPFNISHSTLLSLFLLLASSISALSRLCPSVLMHLDAAEHCCPHQEDCSAGCTAK